MLFIATASCMIATVAAEPYLLFNTILTIYDGIDPDNQPGLYNTTMQYGYRPGLSVVYYSILLAGSCDVL